MTRAFERKMTTTGEGSSPVRAAVPERPRGKSSQRHVREDHAVSHAIFSDQLTETKDKKKRIADQILKLKKELVEATVDVKRQERRVHLAKNLADMDVPEDIQVEQRYGVDHADQLEWRVSWEGVRFTMDLRLNLRAGTDDSSGLRYPLACPVTAVDTETPGFRTALDAAREEWSPATTPANLVVALHAR